MPPQKTPSFDVAGARKAGYSDDEILSHLTQSRKFDVQGALKSGYSKSDLIGYLSTTPSQALNLPGGQPGDADYATNQAQDVIKKQASGMQGTREGMNIGASGDVAGARGAGDAVQAYTGDIPARDQANLQRAAKGQPQQPVGAAPRMVDSTMRGLATVAGGMAEHPALTTGIALANSNPITAIPVDAVLMGMTGADVADDIGDIAKKGFTADNIENLGVHGANTALAGAGFGGQFNELRNVPLDVQNEYAQRGLKPAGKGQQQFQNDIEGARPYLGGKGINSQSDLQGQLPGAKNEVWAPYDAAMQRIGQQPAQGPNGPTTYGALEERRAEISAQLHAVHSKDDATLQTILQQGKTPADLEAESTAIKAVLDPRLQAEGINPLAIRNTEGNIKGIDRTVSGRNTISEDPQKYGFGRYLSQMKLTEPSSWLPGYEVANDLRLHRPLWSGKPTDVDIKTGLLSGADKPDFTNITSPQPLGPQGPPPPIRGLLPAPSPTAPARSTVNYGQGGGPSQLQVSGPTATPRPMGPVQPGAQNIAPGFPGAAPTPPHPLTEMSPYSPSSPFVLPGAGAQAPTTPVGGLPTVGFSAQPDLWSPTPNAAPQPSFDTPIRIATTPGLYGEEAAAGARQSSMGGQGALAPRSSFGPPFEPKANTPRMPSQKVVDTPPPTQENLALPGGNPPSTPSEPYAGPERRKSVRDVTGPEPMRMALVKTLRERIAAGDPLAQAQLDDILANPFERHEGGDINSMKAKRTMSKEEAEKNTQKRSEGRNQRFAEAQQ